MEVRVLEEAIIMTSAATDTANVMQSFSPACDAYLFKPIDTGKLLDHIRDFHLI